MSQCPNYNSPEWKHLFNQVKDENLAKITWLHYGKDYPKLQTGKDIRDAIKFGTNLSSDAKNMLLARVRKYNAKHGTSHRIAVTEPYKGTYYTTLKYNYLPVNVELARQRASQKLEPYRIDNNDEVAKEFKDTYPSNVKDNYSNPGFIDANIQAVDENGDVVHPDNVLSDVDYLIDTGEREVLHTEKFRKNKLHDEINALKDKIKSSTDPFLIRTYTSQLHGLEAKLESSEQRVKLASNIKKFEEIESFAKIQLKEIEELLSKPSISAENIIVAQRMLNLWKEAGDFSKGPDAHIFLDSDEASSEEITDKFVLIRARAEKLEGMLNAIKTDMQIAFVNKYSGLKLSKEQIFESLKDTSWVRSMLSHAGRNEEPLVKALFGAVESANIQAHLEVNDVWKNIDSAHEKVIDKLKRLQGSGNPFRFLEQKSASGKGTGKVVHRFSDEFFIMNKALRKRAFYKRNEKTGALETSKADVEKYYKWLNDNTITFDSRILFEDSQMEDGNIPEGFLFNGTVDENRKNKHLEELKSHLGQKGLDYYLAIAERKIERFKINRQVKWDDLQNTSLTEVEKLDAFREWNAENSPFFSAEMLEDSTKRKRPNGKGYYNARGLEKYSETVPRKKDGSGKSTKWYDENFEKIEADSDLLEYYNMVLNTMKTMKSYLPHDKQRLLGVNDIPYMLASVTDNLSEKGMLSSVKMFRDKLAEMATTTDLGTIDNADIDPNTGLREKSIQVQMVQDLRAKVADLVKTKTIAFKTENGRQPTDGEIRDMEDDAKAELSAEKSFDLTKLMKSFSLMALSYKHKAIVESNIKLVEQALHDKYELVTNKAGEVKTKDGTPISQEGLKNTKDLVNFHLDTAYYMYGGRKVEGVSKIKIYTPSEKVKKKELEALIEKTTNEKDLAHLNEQLNKLGGYAAAGAIGDMALKYMTFRGLGWNIPSAFSNMGFGFISNLIHSSDGRMYTTTQIRKAYMLANHSILKNATFNKVETESALKIRTLMDKWDLLKTSQTELFEKSDKSSIVKGLGRFGPMSLQERSEYLNYAPLMIATMMNMKATNSEGKEVELWEAYNADGELREGYSTDVDEVRLIKKIKRSIEVVHGDYNNALRVKATFAGRALSQFRTWMFQGFANRFEKEDKLIDADLSYGTDEYIRKGRYRSYTAGQLATAGTVLGTLMLPGIGTAAGAVVGGAVGKFFGLRTETSVVNDTLFTLKQLARKLAFQKTQFGEKFSETDAANMRMNMTELYILMGIAGLGLLITAMGGDDEDEEKMYAANFLLNQMTRMQTDITFYTNPMEAEKLTKTAVPMASIVSDAGNWFMDVQRLYDEDSENDVFQSGPFKGSSKASIHGFSMIPGFSQGIKGYRYISNTF